MNDKIKLTNDAASEIYLEDIVEKLLRKKFSVIGITLAFAILGAITSLIMTPQFESKADLLPATKPAFYNNGSSTSLNLGGLSSLLGNSIGDVSDTQKNLAILKSRKFIYTFMEENKLLPILYDDKWNHEEQKWIAGSSRNTLWFGYTLFTKDVLTVSVDRVSGIVSIIVTWEDPVLAAEWADKLIRKLNFYARERALSDADNSILFLEQELSQTSISERKLLLFSMIEQETRKKMYATVTEEFAFSVIDKPVVAELRSKPKRALITILSAIFGGFVGCFFVVMRKN